MRLRIPKALAVAAALLFLAAGGCTDTTVEPKSTLTEANVFDDPASYQMLIAKVYAGLAVTGQRGQYGAGDITHPDEGFTQYVRLLWEFEQLPTDEVLISWGGDAGLLELNSGVWGSSNAFLQAMYYRIFFQVMMANEFLRQTTDAKLDERGNVSSSLRAQIATWRAEARFLRALSYWHGIDLFGSIPLVTENDPLGATPPQQATRADIYNFIVSELTTIIPELPAPGASTYGRATGTAGSMLLAKLYMNAEVYTGAPNYGGVLTALAPVLAGPYTLAPVYRNNFRADNHTSPEIIFAVTQDGQRTQAYGAVTFLIHASCGGPMVDSDYGISGCWWGIRLKPQGYNLYLPPFEVAGDTRSSYFVDNGSGSAVTNMFNFTDGIAAPKYINKTSTGASGSDATFVDTDYPMFRLADAYLMYAEAVVRGGGGTRAQALAYINALRQRAYGNTSGDITDPEMTLQFILDERGRELLWEGHRRTDLVRYGLFTGGTYIWAWKGNVLAGQSTSAHLNLYPLPANELVANPNLTQNPGY